MPPLLEIYQTYLLLVSVPKQNIARSIDKLVGKYHASTVKFTAEPKVKTAFVPVFGTVKY